MNESISISRTGSAGGYWHQFMLSHVRTDRTFNIAILSLILALFAMVLGDTMATVAANHGPSAGVSGVVKNTSGAPVANATITNGTNYVLSDDQGRFELHEPTAYSGHLTVSGPGYDQKVITIDEPGGELEVVVSEAPIKGIYFNPVLSYSPEGIANFIAIANTTEINAVIIDIKDRLVYFDSENALFRDAGMVMPMMDVSALLEELHANGIYTIARIAVFKDSFLAEKYPQYAVLDTYTGAPWRDLNGAAWVNPLSEELWDANISLAEEAIQLGFDEVQYDYIRFPTDGDLSRAFFGGPVTAEEREAAITGFLNTSRDRLAVLGGRQSADVYGYTTVIDHDLGIGQTFTAVADTVDYMSPMVYPSHWPTGSLYGIPGLPNDYPYLVVYNSMDAALGQIEGKSNQLRPWLQDFTLAGMYPYGPLEVRAQIDALADLGIQSWLIWSLNNWYHTDAFLPDSGIMSKSVAPIIRRSDED